MNIYDIFASWVIFHAFLSSADFFQNQLVRKILSGIPSECQIVWIQIRPDILLGLIWVQSICKSYQQTTLGDKELNTQSHSSMFFHINEPVHEISNNVVCATSKASDQPVHMRSLIRAFASRLSILRLLSY